MAWRYGVRSFQMLQKNGRYEIATADLRVDMAKEKSDRFLFEVKVYPLILLRTKNGNLNKIHRENIKI